MQICPPSDPIADLDFEALYQGKPPMEGVESFEVAPWDIAVPQPAVVALEDSWRRHRLQLPPHRQGRTCDERRPAPARLQAYRGRVAGRATAREQHTRPTETGGRQ